MDPSYDRKKADEILQRLFDLRGSHNLADGPQQLNTMDHDAYMFADFQNPRSWRLIRKTEDDALEKGEAIFRIQGVLCGFDLPPIPKERLTRKANSCSNKANIQHIHLRQSVTITSFGECSAFDNAARHFSEVGLYTADYFGGDLLKFNPGMWEGGAALSFHSRYFTLRHDAPTERGQDFGPGVDPKGVLRALLGHNMVHTVDNKVKYTARVEEKGQVRYIPVEPSVFGLGDIVEVSFAFYCAPAKGQKVVFAPHLRGLTLLDDSVRKEARDVMSPRKKSFTLKRVAWEMLDGETEEVERMRKMTIC